MEVDTFTKNKHFRNIVHFLGLYSMGINILVQIETNILSTVSTQIILSMHETF